MSSDIQELKSVSCPLHGVNLIEAAAGTGKTYNIQNLVVRLVLEEELPVTSILVVTYTEAAAAELRDRIQKALKFTFDALSGSAPEAERSRAEALLERVSGKEHKKVWTLLYRALQQFDDAVITTIHGFCRRVLSENAFESGILFNTALEKDLSGRIELLCADFYRRKVYAPECSRLDMVLLEKAGFDEKVFGRDFRSTVTQRELKLDGTDGIKLPEEYRRMITDGLLRLVELAPPEAAITGNQPENWSADDWKYLAGMTGKKSPDNEFAYEVKTVFDNIGKYGIALRLEALSFVRQGLEQMKLRDNIMGFDDLLIRTRDGINAPGGRLLNALQKRYKAGIIDEFQDTDPVQYEIFFRIFASVSGMPLFMVGDPRQAIYSFRGGDLATYFHADDDRQRCGGAKYTLTANYRSSGAMIKAVNRIFAEHSCPFASDRINFSPISIPEPEIGSMTLHGQSDTRPLRIVRIPDANYAECDKWCAGEILSLLRAEWQIPGREKPGIEPGDIAVLVFDSYEADNMRKLLRDRKIPAVCTRTGNVFATGEAGELLTFLQAVLEPGRRSMVCNALATSIGGMSETALAEMMRDENSDVFAEKQKIFTELNAVWQEYYFMGVFQRILELFRVKERYPAIVNGERKLTDLLQLGDLLQQASGTGNPAPHALLSLLAGKIRDSGSDKSEESEQLLETDRKAVKIMTVHRSKGLEFPIVMLPGLFRWYADDKEKCSSYHDHDGILSVDFANTQESLQQCFRERMQELLRLVYVALTRAKYRCHLYWGRCPAGRGEKRTTALDWLFRMRKESYRDDFLDCLKGKKFPAEDIPEDLLSEDVGGTPVTGDYIPPINLDPEWCFSEPDLRVMDSGWRMISYSSLSPRSGHSDRVFDDDRESESESREEEAGEPGIMSIPGGASLGNAWHAVFEEMAFDAGDEAIRETAYQSLIRYGVMRAADTDKNILDLTCRMVRNVLDTPLADGLYLRNIDRKDRISEMEFCYSFSNAFSSPAIRKILGKYAAERFGLVRWPEWQHEFSGGCLNGFIDLIFRHRGKYYILDWKSNRLGGRAGNFEEKGLCREMAESFYFLQYFFYTVALMKYLRLRLGKFGREEYDSQFGGIYYIFLRGVSPDFPGRGIFFDRPDFDLISALEKEIG